MNEKTYRVTLLVEKKIKVRACEEIEAECKAIEEHEKTQPGTPVYYARVKSHNYDSGFYMVPDSPEKAVKKPEIVS